MDALAADFCPPKKTIVETIAAAPSRLARFCFSFSLSSEDDSDEDATIEKHVSFVLFLFDDDDALLLMKILLPVGFCSRLEDDDRIIHLSFFEESLKEEEEEPTKADTKAALLLIEDIIEFAFFALAMVFTRERHQQQRTQLSDPFLCSLSGFFSPNGGVLLNPHSHETLNKKNSSYCVYSHTHRGTKNRERSESAREI
jgi:hypothetical protein